MGARWRSWVAGAVALLLLPNGAFGWGASAHKLITSKAVESLPPEMQEFFEASREQLASASLEPLEWMARNPAAELRHRYIFLDRYGRFPFDALPRDYNTAVRLLTKKRLDSNGVLPWQVGVYSEKLTNAFRARNWEEVKKNAAILAHYVAQAHDPFSTTENFDGKITGQPGVDVRYNTSLVDRFSLFFFVRPNDAHYISDPTDHAFEQCLSAHGWLYHVLLADRRAKRGLSDYTDEYYDRLYAQAGAILIRQISDASTDVGSYWLTAWINAGRPRLPPR